MSQRVLSVWLPNWPVQRLRAISTPTEPNGQQPIVLLARDPRRGPLVVACCRHAIASGIQTGMSAGEASSLLKASHNDCRAQQHDSQADLETLRQLAETCTEYFSPIVALDPMGPRRWSGQLLHMPDGLLMDVTAIGPLFGGEESLCQEVEQFFKNRGFTVSIALADSIAAAWGLARSRTRGKTEQTPKANYLITDSEDQLQSLFTLPTSAMRLSPDCVNTLSRLGIETFGSLLELPRKGLASRLDPELMLRIDQLLGNVEEAFPAFHRRVDDQVIADLDCPTFDAGILEYAIQSLIQQLTSNLKHRGHGALRLQIRFEILQRQPIYLSMGLYCPCADPEHLCQLALENFSRTKLPAEVHRIEVTATLTAPLMQHQKELINDAHHDRSTSGAAANLIDNLSGRLGRQSVLGVRRTSDPLPEDAFKIQPLTGQPIGEITRLRKKSTRRKKTPRPTSRHAIAPSSNDPLRRPMYLEKEPIRLRILKIENRQPPRLFQFRNQQCQTHRFWGPERIETNWWKGPCQRRDYFRIETTGAQWLWIYRELTTNDWYLHGWFD